MTLGGSRKPGQLSRKVLSGISGYKMGVWGRRFLVLFWKLAVSIQEMGMEQGESVKDLVWMVRGVPATPLLVLGFRRGNL